MAFPPSIRQFISKNLVLIVMLPVLAGAHYGWVKLQFNEDLVTPEERRKIPFLREK